MAIFTETKNLSSWIYVYVLTGIIVYLAFLTGSRSMIRAADGRFVTIVTVFALVVLQYMETNRIYKRSKWAGKFMVVIPGALVFMCAFWALFLGSAQIAPA